MRDDRCECGECTGADAKIEVDRLRAQVESLRRALEEMERNWKAAADYNGRLDGLLMEAQRGHAAEVERLRAAAHLVLRWEGDVPPHGGLASDLAFLRANLGPAPVARLGTLAERVNDPAFKSLVEAKLIAMSCRCVCGRGAHEHFIEQSAGDAHECSGFSLDLSQPAAVEPRGDTP